MELPRVDIRLIPQETTGIKTTSWLVQYHNPEDNGVNYILGKIMKDITGVRFAPNVGILLGVETLEELRKVILNHPDLAVDIKLP